MLALFFERFCLAFGVEQIKCIFKSPTVETVGYDIISQTIEIIKMRDENMEVQRAPFPNPSPER